MLLIPRGKYARVSELSLSPSQTAKRDEVCKRLIDGTYAQEEVSCFCGNDNDVVVAERDRYGLPVRTVLCMSCGLMRCSPRMTLKATAAFYVHDYRILYTSDNQNADTLWNNQRIQGKYMVKECQKILKAGDLIYDIGAGTGGMMAVCKEAGYRVAGCDLDSRLLDTGRAHGIDLVTGTIDDLVDYMGEQADLLYMINVFEHYLDLPGELEKIINAIKPGGYLIMQVPGIGIIDKWYHSNVLRYLQNAHTYHFTAATLRYVLETCGLKVIIADNIVNVLARRPLPDEEVQVHSTVGTDEANYIVEYLGTLEHIWGKYGQSDKGND